MKTRKKLIISFLFLFVVFNLNYSAVLASDNLLNPEFVENDKNLKNNNAFNLANLVDNILKNNNESKKTIDEKKELRKDFLEITSKFNQGNAKVAYDEYEKFLDKVENDNSLLALAKVFYEIGYFSLANKAQEKIFYKNQFYDNMMELERAYMPQSELTKEQEIYFAKLYSNIYFSNLIQETISELVGKKEKIKPEYQKNDYALFMLSRAYLSQKQYQSALNYVSKAITINPTNIEYQMHKLDILICLEKYKEAKNLIKKLEKRHNIILRDKIALKKEIVLANLANNEKEKKYHVLNVSYLEGNFEKTKKDCLNIINFDKNNDNIIALYAKSELALGEIKRANVYFVNAHNINKNNINTLIGIGDIRYLYGDYKNAIKSYKKALKQDKNNYEIIIKLACANRQYQKNQKELKKLEDLIDKMPKDEYLSYYNTALTLANKNDVLKEDYLKRALLVNPLHEQSMGQLIELYLKNKNYELASNLIYDVSFTLEKNYYYYYLCALYNQALNKNQLAIYNYKKSLSLNPNFEIANKKLLKLIPDNRTEEI